MTAPGQVPEWLAPYRSAATDVDLDRDIIGLDEVREAVRGLLARLMYPARLEAMGGRMTSGVILHGPAGVGKTLMARAIARRLATADASTEFYAIPGSILTRSRVESLGAWVADRDQATFAVLYMDEIDHWARAAGPGRPRSEVLLAMLSVLDGFQTRGRRRFLPIAATNVHLSGIDDALTRGGRLELAIAFDLPTLDERERLFRHVLRNTPQAALDYRRAARLAGRVSSARVVQYAEEAIARALAEDPSGGGRLEWSHVESSVRGGGRVSRQRRADPHVIAIHEAGHVVCARALPSGLALDITVIHQASGLSRWEREDELPWLTHAQARAMLAVCYAGALAEELVLGDAVLGSADDLWQVNGILDQLGSSGMLGAYPPINPARFSGERGTTDMGAAYVAAAAIAQEERSRARAVLLEHRDEIERVAARIEELGSVTLEDLDALLREKTSA